MLTAFSICLARYIFDASGMLHTYQTGDKTIFSRGPSKHFAPDCESVHPNDKHTLRKKPVLKRENDNHKYSIGI